MGRFETIGELAVLAGLTKSAVWLEWRFGGIEIVDRCKKIDDFENFFKFWRSIFIRTRNIFNFQQSLTFSLTKSFGGWVFGKTKSLKNP
jgi:hypothetical protein